MITGSNYINNEYEPEDLRVDFMPNDPAILGFTNRWYTAALVSAINSCLPNGKIIRILSPSYFTATKLEAYRGRGGGDLLGSSDIEDILAVIDGCHEWVGDVQRADEDLRCYIRDQLGALATDYYFGYAVQSAAKGDPGREALIFDRIRQLLTS
jgi:hypothetical protein